MMQVNAKKRDWKSPPVHTQRVKVVRKHQKTACPRKKNWTELGTEFDVKRDFSVKKWTVIRFAPHILRGSLHDGWKKIVVGTQLKSPWTCPVAPASPQPFARHLVGKMAILAVHQVAVSLVCMGWLEERSPVIWWIKCLYIPCDASTCQEKGWCPSTPWLHSCGPTWVDRSTVNYGQTRRGWQ